MTTHKLTLEANGRLAVIGLCSAIRLNDSVLLLSRHIDTGWEWDRCRQSVSKVKSNQIFICSNKRNQKIDNNSDSEQDSKAQEALTAALVNNSKISTRNS